MTRIQRRRNEQAGARRGVASTADDERSLLEVLEQDNGHAGELAAARLALTVQRALASAIEASGIQRSALAERLGVTPSAVTQVLESDGNLRIATIGRYARALGYQPAVCLYPVEPGRPPVPYLIPANVRSRDAAGREWQIIDVDPFPMREVAHGDAVPSQLPSNDMWITLHGRPAVTNVSR